MSVIYTIFIGIMFVLVLGLALYSLQKSRETNHRIKAFFEQGDKNFENLVTNFVEQVKANSVRVSKIENSIKQITSVIPNSHQKLGMVRFNPFSDTGGDQSFALCILNGHDSGIIITAIHGREGTRVYIKPIEYGKSIYSLSKEEEISLNEAVAKK